MIRKKIFHISAWISVLPVLFLPSIIRAAGPLDAALGNQGLAGVQSGAGITNPNPLPALIGDVISVILGALGILLVINITYAGIMYMTANGEDDKVKKAKKMITQSVIGIILIVAAFAISTFVLQQANFIAKGN